MTAPDVREPDPDALTQLSAQHIHASVVHRDGADVLLVHDEVSGIEVASEVGSPVLAARGLERLASAALMAADLLRRRAVSARPRAGH